VDAKQLDPMESCWQYSIVFPKNIEKRERFSKTKKTMYVHAPLESSFACIPSLCEVLTAQKHGFAIAMQKMIFPPCSAFFCQQPTFF
jgi:hypothetical protein